MENIRNCNFLGANFEKESWKSTELRKIDFLDNAGHNILELYGKLEHLHPTDYTSLPFFFAQKRQKWVFQEIALKSNWNAFKVGVKGDSRLFSYSPKSPRLKANR